MTVSAGNDRIAGPFTATGGETALAYDFRLLEAGDIAVWRRRSGVMARLILNTDYTVAGVGNNAGGSILLLFAAIAGDEYVLLGDRRHARTADLVYAKSLPPVLMNGELDALQMQLVELAERIDRALLRSIFDGPSATPLEMPEFRANTVLGFAGDRELVLYDRDPGGAIVLPTPEIDFLIKDRDLSTPPVSPSVGDQYLIKPPGSGAWGGRTGKMRWNGTAWVNTEFARGQAFVVEDEQTAFTWNGAILKEVMGRGVRDIVASDLDPGASAAANTAVMNTAIAKAAAVSGGAAARIVCPGGQFVTNAWNQIDANSTIVQGVERYAGGTEFRFANATGNCIAIAGSHTGLRNLYLSANVKRTVGCAVAIFGGAFMPTIDHLRIDYHNDGINVGPSAGTRIKDVVLRYMNGSYGIRSIGTGDGAGGVYGVTLRDVTADNPYPLGLTAIRGWTSTSSFSVGEYMIANNIIWQCAVGGTSSATAPSGIPGTGRDDVYTTQVADGSVRWVFVAADALAWVVQDSWSYSFSVMDSELINGGIGFVQRDVLATGTSAPRWCNTFNMECDHSFHDCVLLQAGHTFQATQGWWGSSLYGNGFHQAATHGGGAVIGEGTRLFGNAFHGALIEGPDTQVLGAISAANSQNTSALCHGITAAATARGAQVIGSISGRDPDGSGQQGYGVACLAGSDEWIVANNILKGNVTGGFSGSTAASRIAANNIT